MKEVLKFLISHFCCVVNVGFFFFWGGGGSPKRKNTRSLKTYCTKIDLTKVQENVHLYGMKTLHARNLLDDKL